MSKHGIFHLKIDSLATKQDKLNPFGRDMYITNIYYADSFKLFY